MIRGCTPLAAAALNGHYKAACLLVDAGADVNSQRATAETPLHLAARAGHDRIVALLVSAGADLRIEDNCGATPYMAAAVELRQRCCEVLAAAGGAAPAGLAARAVQSLAAVQACGRGGAEGVAERHSGERPLGGRAVVGRGNGCVGAGRRSGAAQGPRAGLGPD